MRIFMLLIIAGSLACAMEHTHGHKVYPLEGYSLVLSVYKHRPNYTVTSISYREYRISRHEEKINEKKKISYIGSVEGDIGYDECLTEKNARKVFNALMKKMRKLSATP